MMISRRFADKGMYRAKVSSAGRVLLPRYDTAHDIGPRFVHSCKLLYNEQLQWVTQPRSPAMPVAEFHFLCFYLLFFSVVSFDGNHDRYREIAK